MRKATVLILIFLIFSTLTCSHGRKDPLENIAPALKAVDSYTLVSHKNLLTGYQSLNPDGTINAIIEIPAGTTAKWEVTKPKGVLQWELRNGKPRVIQYLVHVGVNN